MRLQKRLFHNSRIRTRLLLLLLLPLIFFYTPTTPSTSPTKHTLPIHQISLSPITTTHTTNIQSSIVLPPSRVLSHLSKLPNNTIIFLTSACITHPPNARELLYLALLHHPAPAIIPYLKPPHHATVSHLLPIIFRASTITSIEATNLEKALQALQTVVHELRSVTIQSSCNMFNTVIPRAKITATSSNNLPYILYPPDKSLVQPPHLTPIPFTVAETHVPTMLFALPWLQLGGSEQAMFHLAEFAKTQRFRVVFIVTQPFWGEVDANLVTKNDWIYRAYQLTNHVYDVVNIAPYYERARMIRYLMEVLKPSFIITGNSRFFYQLLPFVRALLNHVVVADYNHMIHTDWLGGGMPRYAANYTEYLDAHFAASNNVSNGIREWIRERGFNHHDKVRTCYIGTDVNKFHTGLNKHLIRANTRRKLGIANDQLLILFAGRFVLDKGVDVLVQVINKVSSKFAFLIVGKGALGRMVESVEEHGRVIIRSIASVEQMADYFAASDVLLLPSVKEGIALVLYEALANGLLVITTDVGGQKEVITPEHGILLRRGPTIQVADDVVERLYDILQRREYYGMIARNGEQAVRERYTTKQFCECVFEGLKDAWGKRIHGGNGLGKEVVKTVEKVLLEDRSHGEWSWRVFPRAVENVLTVVVVPGCGEMKDSIDSVPDGVDVVVGYDALENVSRELLMFLPAGYRMISGMDLQKVCDIMRRPVGKNVLDVLGVRVVGGKVGRFRWVDGVVERCGVDDVVFGESVEVLKSLDAANVVEVGKDVLKLDWFEVFLVRRRKVLGRGNDVLEEAFRERWNVGFVNEGEIERCGHQDNNDDKERVRDCGVVDDLKF